MPESPLLVDGLFTWAAINGAPAIVLGEKPEILVPHAGFQAVPLQQRTSQSWASGISGTQHWTEGRNH